jgi:SRSO17 transposase
LPSQAVCRLGHRLYAFWERFRDDFKTQTRDGSDYAYHYLSGLLRMNTQRHFAGIGREAGISGQNLQHFMSESPWSGQAVCRQVQEELKATPELTTGGVLLIDESADEKAGDKSAGAGRQYNGRLGKVEMSQVAVLLSYLNLKVAQGFWSWIDGALFLPKGWFEDSHQKLRQRLGVPQEVSFKTKVELAWELIERALAADLPFDLVGFDCLYGRSGELRAKVRQAGKLYMAEVPADTQVYLNKPVLGLPPRQSKRGRPPSAIQVLAGEAVRVDSLREKLPWHAVQVRATDRGTLCDPFAARRVWTVHAGEAVEDWLVMREEADGKHSYALCNASRETSLEQLAWWKCQRYFIERSNQDAKSELGWDELQAQKYRAWEHHLALTVLASWFVAQTKYEWARDYRRDPALLQELDTEVLPALSVANVRTLLRAVMPLRQMSEAQATDLVIEHLLNRARSRKSRLKKQRLIKRTMAGAT